MVAGAASGHSRSMSVPPHARPAPAPRMRAAWLPRAEELPDGDWAWRHRLVAWVLAGHIPVLMLLAGLVAGPLEVLQVLLPMGALLALSWSPLPRRLRA